MNLSNNRNYSCSFRKKMPLAVLKGNKDKKDVTISSVPYAIGRCRTADFIIVDVNVSRNHCQIVKDNQQWKINDFSTTGTYVNDVLIGKGKSGLLGNGDSVRFGPVEKNYCWTFHCLDCLQENSSPEPEKVLGSEKCNIKETNSVDAVEEKRQTEVPLKNFNFTRNPNDLKQTAILDSKNVIKESHNELMELMEEEKINMKSESEKIQELTKELQEVHNALNDLEEKNSALQVELAAGAKVNTATNTNSNLMENLADLMEAEFQCTICSEIFVTAITLSCTHTFCKYCINQWKKKQKTCPICRKKITNETRSLVVDNYIDKVVANLSPELKERRDIIIQERSESEPLKVKSKLRK